MGNEERTLWEGHPSHLKDLPYHVLATVVTLGLGFPFSIARWLSTRCRRYEVTSERIVLAHGVLSRVMEELELYRVKDMTIQQPLLLRLFDLSNLVIKSSDSTTPLLTLEAIRGAKILRDNIRGCVEKLRAEKGVRELDV